MIIPPFPLARRMQRDRDEHIRRQGSGKPLVRLYGKAQAKAASLGLGTLQISLSDSREYAVAVVISETV